MERKQTRAALSAALDRWEQQAGEPGATGAAVAATFEHIEAFALASLAQELAAISDTLQARHGGDPRHGCRGTRTQKGGTQTLRCTRPLGHAGEHVDATGERWGDDAG